MIGNDIIDLEAARTESNWRRKGYLQKIFTETEQLLINNSADPEIMLWSLWSMKEAAYKIYNRQTKIRSYMPLKICCYDITANAVILSGKVSCQGETYFTKTEITSEYVYTIAAVDGNILNKLNNQLYDTYDTIEEAKQQNPIGKDKYGIPFMINKTDTETNIISISHHGRFYSQVLLVM